MLLVNGQPSDTISIQDRGLQYGDGIFETLAVLDGKPLCLDKHIDRLKLGCQRLRIPFTDTNLLLSEILTLSKDQQRTVLKIIITRGAGGRGYQIPVDIVPTRIVSILSWPSHPVDNRKSGVITQLCKSRYGINKSLAGIKHLNRLEQILARGEISDDAVAEGIVMDQAGKIIEGTMSNLFVRLNNSWLTPDLSECGVAGIIRQYILENQKLLGLDINTGIVSIEQLFKAKEIFLCNSIIGIWPVKQIDTQHYSDFRISQQISTVLVEQNIIVPA